MLALVLVAVLVALEAVTAVALVVVEVIVAVVLVVDFLDPERGGGGPHAIRRRSVVSLVIICTASAKGMDSSDGSRGRYMGNSFLGGGGGCATM